METFWMFVKAFLIGGGICLIGQIIINFTHLTNGKILVLFLIAGAVLEGFGLYSKLIEFAGAGASIPISGFGCALVKGAVKSAHQGGLCNRYIRRNCSRLSGRRSVPSAYQKEIIVTKPSGCEYTMA